MIQTQHWEHHLMKLAISVLDGDVAVQSRPLVSPVVLKQAYQYCEQITQQNSRTFYMAARFMPEKKRQATYALYAFCRMSDDLVDCPQQSFSTPDQNDLEEWRKQFSVDQPEEKNHPSTLAGKAELVRMAWEDTRRKFCIPRGYADQLIDGLASDFRPVRYATFTDLSKYCYGVACTVGLMSMCITGFEGREAIPYAIRLGVALQLTNILRDVGEDWRLGRLYLPLEELAAFGLDEESIRLGHVDERWRSFMKYQIARARRLYEDALPGVRLLHTDGRFAIAAAGELYRAILDQIEKNDYDVFHYRAATSTWGKLVRLPGIWRKAYGP